MSSFAQVVDNTEEFNALRLEAKRDIVTNALISDTLKYSKEDTYHTALATLNRNPYGQLFVINGKQYFKFDIVAGKCVVEFINEYLNLSNLKSISKLDRNVSPALYGSNGKNGVVIINLKNLKKASTNNCGFIESKKRNGSNLDQWKEGELRVRTHGIMIKEK